MDEDEGQQLIIYRTSMYKIVIPIFIVISCLGVLANAIVVIALRATKVRNATVTLILSLTISDIWTSSIVAFSLWYNSYLPTVEGTAVNPCFSLTLEMMRTGGLITGIFHLLLIAIHHYIGIVRPYTSKATLKQIALFLCLLAWLTPSIVLFVLALAFPDQGYWNCEDVRFYYTRAFRTSVSSLLTCIFIIITTTYVRLLRILRLQREKWRRQQLYSVATSTTAMMTITATSSRNTKEKTPMSNLNEKSKFMERKRQSAPQLYQSPDSISLEKETESLNNVSKKTKIRNWSLIRVISQKRIDRLSLKELVSNNDNNNCNICNNNNNNNNKKALSKNLKVVINHHMSSGLDSNKSNDFNNDVSTSSPLTTPIIQNNNCENFYNNKKQNDHLEQQENTQKIEKGKISSTGDSINTKHRNNLCNAVTSNNATAERRAARENRTLWTTILICSSFFLGWAPATILFTLTCDTCTILRGNQRFLFYFSCTQLCFILAKSLVNPLIYSLRIPEVDTEIRLFFETFLRSFRKFFRQTCSNKKFPKTLSISKFAPIRNSKRNRCNCVLDSPTESVLCGAGIPISATDETLQKNKLQFSE